MKPAPRIALNLLLPGLIAGGGIGSLIALGAVLDTAHTTTHQSPAELLDDALGIGAIILYATAFTILPAAISTGVLEWLYRKRGLSPASGRAVLISAVLGLLSGLGIILVALGGPLWANGRRLRAENLPTLAAYSAIGTAVGALTGLTLRWLNRWIERRQKKREAAAPKTP